MRWRLEKSPREPAASEARSLREAARRFFPQQHSVSLAGGSSGFSGSAFVRVRASGRSGCLHRWPSGLEGRRLRFVHRVLSESRASGFTGVPELAKTVDGETALTLAGRLYDAQEWLAGEPLSTVQPGGVRSPNVVVSPLPARASSLAAALARFHRSTTNLRERGESASPLPVRLARLAEEAEIRREALLSDVRARAEREGLGLALARVTAESHSHGS